MNEPVVNSLRIRPVFLLWFLAVLGWLVIIASGVLWWGLPRWAPDVVVVESPWLGPAFEAAMHDNGLEKSFRDRLPEWGDQVVPFMCSVATSGGDLKRRQLALRSLHPENDPRATPTLLALLNDPDDKIIHHALYELSSLNDPAIVQPVLDLLLRSSPDVAKSAAGLLAERPQDVPFELVSTILLHASRDDHQMLGCIVLSGGTDPRVIPALVERLGRFRLGRHDAAGYCLAQLELPGTTEAIAAALTDPDPRRRYGAVTAAWWPNPKTDRSALLQPLLRLIADPEVEVRTSAVGALRNFSDDAAISALRSTVAGGGPPAVMAVESLIQNRSPTALPTLLSFIDHPDAEVRKKLIRLVRSFSRIPDGFDHRLVLNLLQHQDPDVVVMAKTVAKDLTLTPDEQRELDAAGK